MPDICANFFSRSELQGMILKADGLRKQTLCADQDRALLSLLLAASELDGILADLAVTPHPVNKALANPNGWEAVWSDGEYCVGSLRIGYGQQVMRIPGQGRLYLATPRYKLTLGKGPDAEVHISSDRAKLKALLVRYVEAKPDVPEDARDFLLNNLFSDVAYFGVVVPEKHDALQEQSATAVDVLN